MEMKCFRVSESCRAVRLHVKMFLLEKLVVRVTAEIFLRRETITLKERFPGFPDPLHCGLLALGNYLVSRLARTSAGFNWDATAGL